MRIYISGGITNVKGYTENFRKAEKTIKAAGHEAVNPAKLCESLPRSFTHAEYMEVCMAALKSCDGIYMLNAWEQSKGAKMEISEAIRQKMTIEFER